VAKAIADSDQYGRAEHPVYKRNADAALAFLASHGETREAGIEEAAKHLDRQQTLMNGPGAARSVRSLLPRGGE
jgi:hypothetical protein